MMSLFKGESMEKIEISFGPQGMIITPHVEGMAPGMVITPMECMRMGIDTEWLFLMMKHRTVFYYEWTEERIPRIEEGEK